MATDLMREYVSGGGDVRMQAMRQVLPTAFDDVTKDFGDDIYDRMALDPVMHASTTILKASILEEGVKITPAVEQQDQDGYELSAEIADMVERTLDDLDTPMDDVLWSMLDCMQSGNKVAELVYEDATVNKKQMLRLRAIKPKPCRAISFVVDDYWNILGYAKRNARQYGLTTIGPDDILQKDKFASMTFRMKDSDPRGTSIYRPAYNAWWLKMQSWPEYLRYLAQFASPGLIGKTAPDAGNIDIVDVSGTIISTVTAEEAMVSSLVEYRNGAVLAFPHGSEVQTVTSTGEGRAFLSAFELFDKQMVIGILTQTLATTEGQHQTRAAAQVHQDVLGTIVRQCKRSVVRMLYRHIITPLVLYNYGHDALALRPRPSLGNVEKQDVAVMITALATAKYALDPSQFPAVDQMLNLPPRMLLVDPQQPVSDSVDGNGVVD